MNKKPYVAAFQEKATNSGGHKRDDDKKRNIENQTFHNATAHPKHSSNLFICWCRAG